MTRTKPQLFRPVDSSPRPARADLPDVIAISAIAKALAHPARVQIVEILRRRDTCIGCDIVEEIGLAASTTSEHLRILKAAGLVVGEIERPRVCYSLNPAALGPLRSFLSHVADTVPARLERRESAKNAEDQPHIHPRDRRRNRNNRAG